MILTIRLRLKDKHAAELNRQARAVNDVWNYCNEMQMKAARSGRKWLSEFDLQKLTTGSSKLLDVHAQTICRVCQQYGRARSKNNRPWLRFRGRKSLGWVPFGYGQNGPKVVDGAFVFRGIRYVPMHMRDVPTDAVIRSGSFSQDARGNWYINAPVEFPDAERSSPNACVGIDLGVKKLATLSGGDVVAMTALFRASETKLGTAQRARKTKRARAIHAKIANRRRDYLHKASAKIAKEFGLIVVGDVSPSKLSQTRMAKSVHDAGWSDFKRMLSYKAIRHGGRMIEVPEIMTTQLCSSCTARSGPKGIAQLGIREWTCGGCGATHDRDVNAARNILARGLASLAEGAAR